MGRRPQFVLDAETGQLSLERPDASEVPPLELQAVFAQVLGIPLEDGRPALVKPQAPVPAAGAVAEVSEGGALVLAAKNAVKDARRALARMLRQRLATLEAGTFEKSVVRMMQAQGFRELKVAKRSKDGPLLTARSREGSVELRYAVRILKGGPSVDRKSVQELRKDLGHYAAQVGLLVSSGDVRGDARSEAQASGSLVMLWCGDALADKFLEVKTGVTVTQVELFELDESFFEGAKVDAEDAQRRREERKALREDGEEKPAAERNGKSDRSERRERRDRERAERRERPAVVAAVGGEESDSEAIEVRGTREEEPARQPVSEVESVVFVAGTSEVTVSEVSAEGGDDEEGDEEEGDEEGGEESAQAEGAAPGTPGQGGSDRKRRRRRRRGRRGRGRVAEGTPGAVAGAPGVASGTPDAAGAASAAPGAPESAGALGAPESAGALERAVAPESAGALGAPESAGALERVAASGAPESAGALERVAASGTPDAAGAPERAASPGASERAAAHAPEAAASAPPAESAAAALFAPEPAPEATPSASPAPASPEGEGSSS